MCGLWSLREARNHPEWLQAGGAPTCLTVLPARRGRSGSHTAIRGSWVISPARGSGMGGWQLIRGAGPGTGSLCWQLGAEFREKPGGPVLSGDY